MHLWQLWHLWRFVEFRKSDTFSCDGIMLYYLPQYNSRTVKHHQKAAVAGIETNQATEVNREQ